MYSIAFVIIYTILTKQSFFSVKISDVFIGIILKCFFFFYIVVCLVQTTSSKTHWDIYERFFYSFQILYEIFFIFSILLVNLTWEFFTGNNLVLFRVRYFLRFSVFDEIIAILFLETEFACFSKTVRFCFSFGFDKCLEHTVRFSHNFSFYLSWILDKVFKPDKCLGRETVCPHIHSRYSG